MGPHLAQIAATLRKPLMPHQRHIADVALEVDPETGLLAYREVVLVLGRQQGKTELLLPTISHRSIAWPNQRTLYTTQTGSEARKKWEDVHVKRLQASPFASLFSVRLRLNAEAVLWSNGSTYSPIATTAKTGGTGDTIDLGIVDEAWSREDSRAEQALRPAMLPSVQPQLWVASMVPGPTRAKTTTSAYLRKKMTTGRALVDAGVRHGTCYFEWGAAPGLDPGDPATWWSCMPALGLTISLAAVRHDYESLDLADFTSEYLSWWPDETRQGWQVIGEQEWRDRRCGPEDPGSRLLDPTAIAVVVAPDRSWTAIAAAGRRAGGGRGVEITSRDGVLDYRPGTKWALGRMKEIADRQRLCVLAVADKALADEAELEGLKVVKVGPGDQAAAAGMLYDGVAGDDIAGRDVWHIGQTALDVSVEAAAKRTVGDTWLFDRRTQPVDITPLVAGACALWALTTPRIHKVGREPMAAWA